AAVQRTAGASPKSTKPKKERSTSASQPDAPGAPDPESPDTAEAIEAEPEVLESEVLDAHFGDEDAPDVEEIEISADDGALPVPASKDHAAIATTDSLARYLSEIRMYPVLSREEEHEIALRYFHQHDADAAVKRVTANL